MPTASWLPREYLVHPSRTPRASISSDSVEGWRCELQDILSIMKLRIAILTGGKSLDGCPVITFPDTGTFKDATDDDYRKIMTYLISLPPLQDVDHGFVLVVDRREEKWNDVKAVITRLMEFFPGLVRTALILRPSGFLQKAISEVATKFFKDAKFQVVVCSSLEELHEHVHPSQLTPDLGGSLSYVHEDWLEQRMAVEKFSRDLHTTSLKLQEATEQFHEEAVPEDVAMLEARMVNEESQYNALKDELCSAARHGETLLGRIRRPSVEGASLELYPDNLTNVTAVERLLVQLDETEKGFAFFWLEHKKYLNRCLRVRKFEFTFKELHTELAGCRQRLLEIPSSGNSVSQVQQILQDLGEFRAEAEENICKVQSLLEEGTQLQSDNAQPESIAPKCEELQSMVEDFTQQMQSKVEILQNYATLHEKIEKADAWCNQGMELLATLQVEKCSFCAETATSMLRSVEEFLQTAADCCAADPDEFYLIMGNIPSPEAEALVKQVMKRIEDVQTYYKEKTTALKKLVNRLQRPVQAVTAVPCQQSTLEYVVQLRDSSSSEVLKKENRNSLTYPPQIIPEEAQLRIKHITAELLDTEESYISQLSSIIQGYIKNMEDTAMKELVPQCLVNKANILFGNIEDIYKFHQEDFLHNLRKSQANLEEIGTCFIERAEAFHKLYCLYSLNKPKSEALVRQCGKENPFFKECQKKLGHKLDLDAYLLIPVQRITKYQLLLKDLVKNSGHPHLRDALNIMLEVVKYINNSMHQTTIIGFQGDLRDCGKLLLQETFYVWMKKKEQLLLPKRQQRHIFLYENNIVVTKRLEKKDGVYYEVRKTLKNSVIGLTETFQEKDPSKFELRLHDGGEDEALILQARNRSVKAVWVKEIRKILSQQFEQIKGEKTKRYSGIQEIPDTNVTFEITLPLKRTHLRLDGREQSVQSEDSDTQNESEPSKCAIPGSGHGNSSLQGDEWCIDFSHSDEENEPAEVHEQYVAHWDYNAVGEEEASVQKGQFVTVEKVDNSGYCFVRISNTGTKGWLPASYLRPYSTDSTALVS